MFLRILGKSILKRKSRIAIAVISVLIGASVATALLTVSLDVSEKVSLEFRKYGANLLVVPQSDTIEVGFPGVEFGSVTEQRYINESDIWKIKTIYWRNNVMGFAPFLYQVVTARSEQAEQRIVLAGTYFNRTIHIQHHTHHKILRHLPPGFKSSVHGGISWVIGFMIKTIQAVV